MKIVNKIKFIRTLSILILIVCAFLIFANKAYSKGTVKYKEKYICTGDTLWSIAKQEVQNNKYFENKDIREAINELKEINEFNTSNVYEGNKIKIPIYE